MKQKKVTEAQKRAQKKYDDEKTKTVSLKFTPKTMNLYNQLKEYTNDTGKTINGFIKELLKDFFENDNDKQVKETTEKAISPNLNEAYENCFLDYVETDYIQKLNDNFGNSTVKKILTELYEMMEYDLNDCIENYGNSFERWIEDLFERIEDSEFELDNKKDISSQLINDMNNYI